MGASASQPRTARSISIIAPIDIGLPELWTQAYKEKFVREFLTAAYERGRDSRYPGGARPGR
jgi:hypothetical protein